MRTSIATVCISGSLEEKLSACSAAGFDGVELFEPDLVASPLSPEQVRRLADELGLALDLYQPFRDLEGVDEVQLEDNLRRARAKFEVMQRLGTDMVLLCSNVGTATVDDDDVAASQLRRLGELAAEYGVRIAYEALAWGTYVNTYEHSWRLVQAADHPNLGLCLDSFHILSRGDDPSGIEKIDGDKIFFVQLADAPRMSLDVLSWSRHYRLFPGEGSWDLPAFLGHVLRAGYTGPVSLEIFNDVFRQSDERRTAVEAMRSLIWLGDQTARRLAAQPEPQPTSVVDAGLITLPDVEDPTGMNFVEVKSQDRESIEELLGQLGFNHSGHHQSKPVQLWTQGNARIIINGQQAQNWEPTIAALGFDVAEPLLSASRARQLKAAQVPRPTHAGEEVLQAVMAPDGTEIFLCHPAAGGVATWSGEFEGGHSPVDSPGLITHIDHVNLAQPWQHFDEAVLFYESALSLDPRPMLEVPGPSGLVRSQVMCSADRAIRLALNVAPLAMEQSGAPVKSAFPQHVAFGCSDLVAVAGRAKERGLEFLHVPGNYYDDLAARFGLDDALLTTLSDLNLLYDRDGEGEFLHFYTETVGNVFLEVVERRSAYDGYGAPNTPVRLAAQYERSRSRRGRA